MPVGEMPPSLKKFLSSAATTALIMSAGIWSHCQHLPVGGAEPADEAAALE